MDCRDDLRLLEAESIHIIREVAAECRAPVMLYSIGKDSSVMLHLALKAFHPGPLPFPLLHVDTGWKFREMYAHRDATVARHGLRLIAYTNPEGVRDGVNPFDHGSHYTRVMKTEALLRAIREGGFDAALGGARRDEERSRAKERVFSFRNADGVWDPRRQRPEFWRLYNGRTNEGDQIRVFPLSNWTEADIWDYIAEQDIPLVPLYFAQDLPVVERDGSLIVVHDERMRLAPGETPRTRRVRFRSLGCYPLTAAMASQADTLDAIRAELAASRTSERDGRLIDREANSSMERKKREGYF